MVRGRLALLALLFPAIFLSVNGEQKPTEEIPFKIVAIGDWTHEFTPVAVGEVKAYVRLDQRECYIHLIVRSPTGRSNNSRRLGYTIFRTTIYITSDELGKPWTVRIKNFCEMKPVSGVLKLFYPGKAESTSPRPSVSAPLPQSSQSSDSEANGSSSANQTTTASPEIRLNGKTRSATGTLPELEKASVEFDGALLSPDPAHREHEEEGWVLLGNATDASVTVTLAFASEVWIAVFVDLSASSSTPVRFSSVISPAADSAVVLAQPSETVTSEATFPVWVRGTAGAEVKLTFTASSVWVRGILIQRGLPRAPIPE